MRKLPKDQRGFILDTIWHYLHDRQENIEGVVARTIEKINRQNNKLSYSQKEAPKLMGIVRAFQFKDIIQRVVVPPKIQLLKLNNYDGTECPKSQSIICKVFASTSQNKQFTGSRASNPKALTLSISCAAPSWTNSSPTHKPRRMSILCLA